MLDAVRTLPARGLSDLLLLNGRWPEWERTGTGRDLVLLGRRSLTDNPSVEVRFDGLVAYSMADSFRDPTFRAITDADGHRMSSETPRPLIRLRRRALVIEAEIPGEVRYPFIVECRRVIVTAHDASTPLG
jgi:hypothetical protein